ncbi:MAG: fibro-slime domain-containing protein [Phycisphaerales bacterium]|nr:fibro-slime domain-containing protein [Phycisphaerales bacterium]
MARSNRMTYGLVASVLATTGLAATPLPSPDDDPPDQIVLTGVVRDFQERSVANGHPDFEKQPSSGFGMYCGNVAANLDSEGKPVFTGEGWKLRRQWRDSAGRNICWRLFDSSRGDRRGRKGADDSGAIDDNDSFRLWYRDDPRYNKSKLLDLTLDRQADGSYVFDSDLSSYYADRGGFFPIDHELYGNSGGSGPDHNFHFTFELRTEFTFEADGAQVFTFRGDDDVWVFIDGNMVIDLGGVHGAIEQTVDLDRLGLQDGETYELAFYFAERHRTESNFRITTNLRLSTVVLPTVTAAYD